MSYMNQSKFKADPYNPNNRLLSSQDIIHIMEKVKLAPQAHSAGKID